MGAVKKPYGPWSCAMLGDLRERGLFKVEAFNTWLAERDIKVDRTLVSHWIGGRSHLPADLLPLIALFTGHPDHVFGGYLREVGCEVVNLPPGEVGARDLTRLMLVANVSLGRLQSALLDAQAPESPGGEIVTREERAHLKKMLNEMIQQLVDLSAVLDTAPPRRPPA